MSRRKNKSAPWRDDAIEAVRNLRAGNVIVHASDTFGALHAIPQTPLQCANFER